MKKKVLNNPDTPQSLEQKDPSPLHITINNRRLHLEVEGGAGWQICGIHNPSSRKQQYQSSDCSVGGLRTGNRWYLNQKNPSLVKHFSWFITAQGNFLLRDKGRPGNDSQDWTQREDGLKSVEFTLIQAFSYIWSAYYTSTEAPKQIKGS